MTLRLGWCCAWPIVFAMQHPALASGGRLPVAVAESPSSELHVDARAHAPGDGSSGAPFRAIAAALARAEPGTRILIAPGRYGAVRSVAGLRGTAEAPIVIVGNGGVVIDPDGSASGMHLVEPQYLTIQGITIRNAVPHGISIDDGSTYDSPAHHIVLRNVTFENIGNGGNNDCLKLSGVDDFRVENSRFSGCNKGEAIDMVGCHRGVITGNTFSDLPSVAVQAKGGSSDVLIHGNRFARIGERAVNAGGMTGTPWFRPLGAKYEAQNIRILSNVIEDTGSAPIVFAGCNACAFANNTVVRPGDFVARILKENPERDSGGNGYFVNNVIVFDPDELRDFVDVRPGTRPSTFTFGWNLWHVTDDASFKGPTYSAGLRPEQRSVVTDNPKLDSSLRPLRGSPAIGAGRDVPGGLAVDFEGRPYGKPPTIGAFSGR